MHPRWIESAQSPSRASNRRRYRRSHTLSFPVSKLGRQYAQGYVEVRSQSYHASRDVEAHSFMLQSMRASEMKNSPSGSHGRAGARISNLPPRLSLLCMVVYIKEEPAMQISMLALLGSRTGEARASVGTAPSNRHIQGMTRLDRCAGQDAEAGRPPIGMRVRMLQRDSSCRIRLLCGCRKTCWQHSYYPNDVRIPWDRFA